jgi:hypothetical protein
VVGRSSRIRWRQARSKREAAEVREMTQQQTVWTCEQWLGGQIKERKVFQSEHQAREFARHLAGVAPDLVLRIEPMPIQLVWN